MLKYEYGTIDAIYVCTKRYQCYAVTI